MSTAPRDLDGSEGKADSAREIGMRQADNAQVIGIGMIQASRDRRGALEVLPPRSSALAGASALIDPNRPLSWSILGAGWNGQCAGLQTEQLKSNGETPGPAISSAFSYRGS